MFEEKMNEKIDELKNENQQLKQQLNSQGEMIRQLQQQMTDIAATSLISPRKDNKIFPIPFLSYQEIEPNHVTEQYFKNLIKYICENYKKVIYGTWIGADSPNNRGWMILTIYNTDNVNQDGFPRHCGGCYQTVQQNYILLVHMILHLAQNHGNYRRYLFKIDGTKQICTITSSIINNIKFFLIQGVQLPHNNFFCN